MQMAGRLGAVDADGRDGGRREVGAAGESRRNAEQTASIRQPVEIVLALLDEFLQFTQCDPAAVGQEVEQAGAFLQWRCRSSLRIGSDRCDGRESQLLKVAEFALRFDVEPANRLDFIPEQLDADRILGIRRPDIENSAVHREFARQFRWP